MTTQLPATTREYHLPEVRSESVFGPASASDDVNSSLDTFTEILAFRLRA